MKQQLKPPRTRLDFLLFIDFLLRRCLVFFLNCSLRVDFIYYTENNLLFYSMKNKQEQIHNFLKSSHID